jgi:hypothetical protein
MGLAKISAIFARSSRVSVSIVVFVSGGFCVVLAISSLYGVMSFSSDGFSVVGLVWGVRY